MERLSFPVGSGAVRKRRTREHVIADLSINYLERHVLNCGWSLDRFQHDYGLDAHIRTFDQHGQIEHGMIYVQVKARSRPALDRSGANIVVDLDARDIDLWLQIPEPVILVVFNGLTRQSCWLHVQAALADRPRLRAARTVRALIPRAQRLDDRAIRLFRRMKAGVYDSAEKHPGGSA